jgi:hypothetical protein
MRLWIDTEYNGFVDALISMALVDETGRDPPKSAPVLVAAFFGR